MLHVSIIITLLLGCYRFGWRVVSAGFSWRTRVVNSLLLVLLRVVLGTIFFSI